MEKLKIYVTARIADILLKDTEGFEFFKKDGRTLNKNALLTQLIINYHNKFSEEQNYLFELLKAKISSFAAIGENKIDELCLAICEKINERSAAPAGEKFNSLVSFKPTKDSEPVLEYIEKYLLQGRTLSEYFRSMFASYAALPQDKREEIIFKPQYDALLKAIKDKKKVFITLANEYNTTVETAPYAVTDSKEELHLYLLSAHGACKPTRLSRIKSVKQLPDDAVFSEWQIQTFEKMLRYGPQFIYKPREERVLVELTAKGIDKYKKIYVHRPVPVKTDNNYYYFECSYTQIVQYFTRFGEDAKIIYPQAVRDEVYNFHKRALDRYK